ncbi:TonB-dependent receptor [Catenovulum sediminis]|uniref:TonB-dependent receptor n=1 Tax=Catenovulum sediminis TaxID=1740262 RepID=UPI0011810603|nr:TonB-dependent receptor [Catenovulum sediminis]
MKSLNQKRFSDNVTDSIFAEDIGKSTDQNIADALSRVTGVSVQSEDGEGTTVSVRGANPNQNVITLNGATLTSSDANQSVDLSSFSSDILSQINVIKTPSADHDEGSLGATIQLKTTKPLNIKNDIKSVTLQGRYNDFSENTNYKISGSFSKKFRDDTFGVLVTAYDETNSVRRDELRINDFEAITMPIASDVNGQILTDHTGIYATGLDYSLYQNKRDRHGATVTFQFLPTDSTDISLDFTYSKQNFETSTDGVTTRTRLDFEPYVEGVVNSKYKIDGDDAAPPFTDPLHDWFMVDTQTRTFVKATNRFGDGGYTRSTGGDTTTNKVVNFALKQFITDTLRMDIGLNYSDTHLVPESKFNLQLLSGTNGLQWADEAGTPHTGIQPVGYDCSTGTCQMVVGTSLGSLEDPTQQFDSILSTGFNPEDITALGTNNLRLRDQEITDTNKTAFIDFDLDIDFAGFTQIEFGVKVSQRDKFNDDQTGKFESAGTAFSVPIFDVDGNVTGSRIVQPGGSLGAVPVANYLSDREFPYDDFMSSLGVASNTVTDGWPLVSTSKLLDIANDVESLQYTVDPTNTRSTTLKNQAAYLKLRFEPLDNLRGDFGVRWVRTEVNSTGYSGVQFFAGDPLRRVLDPFLFRQLRNPAHPNGPCSIDHLTPNETNDREGQYNRIDGFGWDLNGTPTDYSDDVRFEGDPDNYPCYDANTERSSYTHVNIGRHVDIVKSSTYLGNTSDPGQAEDRSLDVFETTGSHEYDLFLPSLNVNYQVNEEVIARFAVSKTMSRPRIDQLKPGFRVNEGLWGQPYTNKGSTVSLSGTTLNPQKSNNLDLSLEWYFNDAGLLSATFFHKDMSDFEESETIDSYLTDLRYVDTSAGFDAANLTKTVAEVEADFNEETLDGIGQAACFPDRGHINAPRQDWWYSEELIDLCRIFRVNRPRNGSGAEITGAELTYNQSYDFLPGIWSGLGAQLSYTYQESKTDPEYSTIDPTKLLESLPRAYVPEHSYNATVFWEKFGHQVRLAYRGKSDQLQQRDWQAIGHLWREGSGTLDLSLNYKINDTFLVSFQAINLADETVRNYFTSSNLDLGDQEFVVNENGESILKDVPYDEGNALDGGVTKSRTQLEQKTGRIFRLGLRARF